MTRLRGVLPALVAASLLLPLAAPPLLACVLGTVPAKACCCGPAGATAVVPAGAPAGRTGGCCEIRKSPGPVRAAVVEGREVQGGRPDQPGILSIHAASPAIAVPPGEPVLTAGARNAPPGDPPERLRLNCLLLI